MGRQKIKSQLTKIGFIIASLVAPLAIAAQASASLPYFRVSGGNISAGGWFNNESDGSACDPSSSNFQASTNSPIKGGILGFVRNAFVLGSSGNNNGAGADLGAFALGTITNGNGSSGLWGFFSGKDGSANLSFANQLPTGVSVSNYGGGYFDGGSHNTSDCIPNYWFSGHPPSTANFTSGSNLNAQDRAKYLATSDVTIPATTINAVAAPGKNVTLFVQGNVYITGNITYDNFNEGNVTKFAVIAKGNIYIGSGVSRLDGFYVAMPDASSNGGHFWTCHETTADFPSDPSRDPSGPWVAQNCQGTSLKINGGVVAKKIELARANGDVNLVPDIDCGTRNASSNNVGETFCFTQDMAVGGEFFNPSTSNSNYGQIQSLINLPPVF